MSEIRLKPGVYMSDTCSVCGKYMHWNPSELTVDHNYYLSCGYCSETCLKFDDKLPYEEEKEKLGMEPLNYYS